MSAAAANHATAAGVDAPMRSRVSWPAFRRALREAHESRLVHAVRIRPDGSLDVILKHEKNSKEQQPSSTEPASNGEQHQLSRRKQKSRERKAKFHEDYPHGKAAGRAPLPQAQVQNIAPSSASVTNYATELPDGAQQAPVTSHETRAIKTLELEPSRPPTLDEMYRALIQRMQCEALDENKDGPSREEQSEQHSSADVPPRGPSKREAALAGAHNSPTKVDGVVHKKTRDGR